MLAKFSDGINPSISPSEPDFDESEPHDADDSSMPIVADAAHDLCNLVNIFKTRLYLTQKSPHRLAENLTMLEHLVDNMEALAQKLLEVSRPQPGYVTHELRPVNLNEVVARIIDAYGPVAQTRNLKLTVEAAPDLSPILADNLELERVVANLVSNALNYTQTGTISVTTAPGTRSVLLTIRDTGIGISPLALPHIFERYYRSHEAQIIAPGTGLGLGIVHEIVEKYGGQIEVESTLGKGSVFKVSLPAHIENPLS